MIRLIKICIVVAITMVVTIGFQPQVLAQEMPMASPMAMAMNMGADMNMSSEMSDSAMPLKMKHPIGWCSDFCFIEGVRNMDAVFGFSDNPELKPVFTEIVNRSLKMILERYVGSEEEYALQPEAMRAAIKQLEEAGYTIR
ncbi:MAG: hypothetical protein F6K30_12960 [Cyanothece sp. SIO2G6]|nr:hypothetical protein [Cyanothece sp. SIO2G6]